jgi:hypothetical protein
VSLGKRLASAFDATQDGCGVLVTVGSSEAEQAEGLLGGDIIKDEKKQRRTK